MKCLVLYKKKERETERDREIRKGGYENIERKIRREWDGGKEGK